MQTTAMPLRKARKTVEIFSVSLLYLVRHARSILGAIALLALPFIIASRLLATVVTGNYRSLDKVLSYRSTLDKNQFILLVLAFIISIASGCIFNLVLNKQLVLGEAAEDNEAPAARNIKENFLPDLRDFSISFLIVFTLYFIMNEILVFLMEWLRQEAFEILLPDTGLASFLTNFFVAIIPAFILLAIGLFLGFATLYICYRDKVGANEGFKKAWQLTQQNKRKTWTTVLLTLTISYIAYGIVRSAHYAINFSLGFGDIMNAPLFFIIDLLQTIAACFIIIYFQVAVVFLLGSLEDEAEGHFIRKKIETV